jgi:hypothetical protein
MLVPKTMLVDKTHVVVVEDPTRQDLIKRMVSRLLLRVNSNASLVSLVLPEKRRRVVKVVRLLVVMAKVAPEDDSVVAPKTVEKTAGGIVVMVNTVVEVKTAEVARTVAVADKEMELKLLHRKPIPTILSAITRV